MCGQPSASAQIAVEVRPSAETSICGAASTLENSLIVFCGFCVLFPASCGCVRQQQPKETHLLPVTPLLDLLATFPWASGNVVAVTQGTRLGSPSPDKPTNSGSGPAPVANLVLTDDFVKQGRDTRRKSSGSFPPCPHSYLPFRAERASPVYHHLPRLCCRCLRSQSLAPWDTMVMAQPGKGGGCLNHVGSSLTHMTRSIHFPTRLPTEFKSCPRAPMPGLLQLLCWGRLQVGPGRIGLIGMGIYPPNNAELLNLSFHPPCCHQSCRGKP